MTHIYDWIDDDSTTNDTIKSVKKWFDRFCCPAWEKVFGTPRYNWLNQRILTCEYNGQKYRCTGASRLGDIWLTKNINQSVGYQLRVNVDECSNWDIQINK